MSSTDPLEHLRSARLAIDMAEAEVLEGRPAIAHFDTCRAAHHLISASDALAKQWMSHRSTKGPTE